MACQREPSHNLLENTITSVEKAHHRDAVGRGAPRPYGRRRVLSGTKSRVTAFFIAVFVALLSACNLGTVSDAQSASTTLVAAVPAENTPQAGQVVNTPHAAAGVVPIAEPLALQRRGVWLHPGLPPRLTAATATLFNDAAQGFVPAQSADEAAVQITFIDGEGAALESEWIYVVVAPFFTVADGVTWEGLGRYWQGQLSALPGFGQPRLVLSEGVAAMLTMMYGTVAANTPLTIVPAERVLSTAQASQPALSVVPFENLEPGWKVLSVDGQSPLDKALNTDDYRFRMQIGLTGEAAAVAQTAEALQASGQWPPGNHDAAHMTLVTMTGVTALARAVAWQMEQSGIVQQGANIKPLLADADVLHISNEVSFNPTCAPPSLSGEAKFCSDDRYIELLLDLGPDIVELTGNHINDYGAIALVHSMDVYDATGLLYFGGGRTLDEARRTLVVNSFGNRIAFVGCNLPGPFRAWATETTAGAAPCDDYVAFRQQVADAKRQADVVIVTQQYWEFAHPDPTPQQSADFRALVDAGAGIVSGSQAHQPQTLELYNGRLIHYGLGNLFFDPFEAVEKQFFIDKHVIYEGRHISTVLLTGTIENYGRPRPMSAPERRAFLQSMFAISK